MLKGTSVFLIYKTFKKLTLYTILDISERMRDRKIWNLRVVMKRLTDGQILV